MVLTNRRIMQLKAPGFAEIQRAAEMGQPPTSMADLPAAKVSWAVSWQVGSLANHAVRSGHRQDVCLWAPALYLRDIHGHLSSTCNRMWLPCTCSTHVGMAQCLQHPVPFTSQGFPGRQDPALCACHEGLSHDAPDFACTSWQTAVQPSLTPDSLLVTHKF